MFLDIKDLNEETQSIPCKGRISVFDSVMTVTLSAQCGDRSRYAGWGPNAVIQVLIISAGLLAFVVPL